MQRDGTQIREKTERAPQPQQSLLGSHRRVRVRPLRSADGAQQHGIRTPASVSVAEAGAARRIDRGAADQRFGNSNS